MCKVAAVAGITDQNRDKVWEFIRRLGVYMTPGNNDGLGYAAFDKSGNIFGERWLVNSQAFSASAVPKESTYNWFGKNIKRDEATSIILHTRKATCDGGMNNTHPFIDKLEGSPNIALIHNGIIYNQKQLTNKFTTCDSETILHEYSFFNVSKDPKRLNEVFDRLQGWYACAVLSTDNFGMPILDLFSDGTSLNSYWIEALGVRIFSTRAEHIASVCGDMGIGFSEPLKLGIDTYRRYDVRTGKLIERGTVKRGDKNFDDFDWTGLDGWTGSWGEAFSRVSKTKEDRDKYESYWRKLLGDD